MICAPAKRPRGLTANELAVWIFENRVATIPVTGCWIYEGANHSRGYGRVWNDGKSVFVHRLMFEQYVGPIGEGLTIDHLCRTHACCNPAHLEPVTLAENVLRGEGLPAKNAVKTHCDHGHSLSGANLYVRRDGRRQCRECDRQRMRRRYRKRRMQKMATLSTG